MPNTKLIESLLTRNGKSSLNHGSHGKSGLHARVQKVLKLIKLVFQWKKKRTLFEVHDEKN